MFALWRLANTHTQNTHSTYIQKVQSLPIITERQHRHTVRSAFHLPLSINQSVSY